MPMALTSAAMATGTPSATTLAFQLLSNGEVSLSNIKESAPDNFDYHQYGYWSKWNLIPTSYFLIGTCIYKKKIMRAYTCI